MFDASPKLPYGILTGNRIEYGNYDQCLRANYEDENVKILGKFCLNAIFLMLPTDFEEQSEQNEKNTKNQVRFVTNPSFSISAAAYIVDKKIFSFRS